MQVVTLVAFLAETFQPMLADEIVIVMVAVFIRTKISQRAKTLAVCLTGWPVGIETEAVFSFEEVGESELIGWKLLEFVGPFVVEVHRRSSTVVDCGSHGVWSRCGRANSEL